MKVAALQFNITWENPTENFRILEEMVEKSDLPPGTLLVLPELFAVGFTMDVQKLGEPEDGPTWQFLRRLAMKYQLHVLGGQLVLGAGGKGLNRCIGFASNGTSLGTYQKLQPFAPGGESASYQAGSQPMLFQLGDIRIGPFICYDLRFPEIFRPLGRQATHLYTVIASWPIARIHHWERLLKARAIENQAFLVGVNRTGQDPLLTYSGKSLIIDYHGEILADAGAEPGVITAELDLNALDEYRKKCPFLSDIRPDYVQSISKSSTES